jgi:hypothetical protein
MQYFSLNFEFYLPAADPKKVLTVSNRGVTLWLNPSWCRNPLGAHWRKIFLSVLIQCLKFCIFHARALIDNYIRRHKRNARYD